MRRFGSPSGLALDESMSTLILGIENPFSTLGKLHEAKADNLSKTKATSRARLNDESGLSPLNIIFMVPFSSEAALLFVRH